jgi:hypothetical protein
MKLTAAASSSLRALLTGPAQPARWLGATPAALYLATATGPSVAGSGVTGPGAVGLLACHATRLPCGLLLAGPAAEQPLTALAPPGDLAAAGCLIGGGLVQWTGPHGPVIVRVVREWSPARPAAGAVAPAALAEMHALLPSPAAAGLDAALLAELIASAGGRVTAAQLAGLLLGRGPGLTPAGDDALAGFLIGARTFGLPASGLRNAIAALAPARTTALSAALLRHAAEGECIDEAAELAAALTGRGAPGPALQRLLRVGHTSGAALACGLVAVARAAIAAANQGSESDQPGIAGQLGRGREAVWSFSGPIARENVHTGARASREPGMSGQRWPVPGQARAQSARPA